MDRLFRSTAALTTSSTLPPASTRYRRQATDQTLQHRDPHDHNVEPSNFETFAESLRDELAPSGLLENLLADRAILAAWTLHVASRAETDKAARRGPSSRRRRKQGDDTLVRELFRTERSLERSLRLLREVRDHHRPLWGRDVPERSKTPSIPFDEPARDEDLDFDGNEWPIIPREPVPVLAPADEEDDDMVPEHWEERLVFDANVSDRSPVVKGTWVTVSHVVTLIVDGWSWSDILRTHPELTEADIRVCLAYTVAQDSNDGLI